jgi:hypothetical protein
VRDGRRLRVFINKVLIGIFELRQERKIDRAFNGFLFFATEIVWRGLKNGHEYKLARIGNNVYLI